MQPEDIYFGTVCSFAVLMILGFFIRWWYEELQDMKQLRARYVRSIAADHAILSHKVLFIAVCFFATATLIFIWVNL